jgi:FkbM family methyltransferase
MGIKELAIDTLRMLQTHLDEGEGGIITKAERRALARQRLRMRLRSSIRNRQNKPLDRVNVLGSSINVLDSNFFQFNLDEVFGDEEYFVPLNKQNPTIVDCGANIGLATLYFKRLFPDCVILAIEGHPTTFSVLQANIADNSLEGVIAINALLTGSDVDEASIYSKREGDLRATTVKELYAEGGEDLTSIDVKAIRLSSVLPPKVDILKMDIEGGESEVLLEIRDHLINIDKIILEFHNVPGRNTMTLAEMLRYLEESGFTCIVKGSAGAPISTLYDRPYANVVYAYRS